MQARAQNLELLERRAWEVEQETSLAQKELTLRTKQRQQLDVLKSRLARGRAEHREKWHGAATHLRQSHKNFVQELLARQEKEAAEAEKLAAASSQKVDELVDGGKTGKAEKLAADAFGGTPLRESAVKGGRGKGKLSKGRFHSKSVERAGGARAERLAQSVSVGVLGHM